MTHPTVQQLGLYIGCPTNIGKFVGIVQNIVYTQQPGEPVKGHELSSFGNSIKLQLRKLNALTEEESDLLIKKGFSIGRPNGYSFSPESILYLTSLGVDLFGLIESGFAQEITGSNNNAA